jgi:hypothetical protein
MANLKAILGLTVFGTLVAAIPAAAVVNPYTETFAAAAAGWSKDSAGTTPADWFATAGPADGPYIDGEINFTNFAANTTPIAIHGGPTASGGAFVGNWLDAGVEQFTAFVKHDAALPLSFFVRFAPFGGPGAVGLSFVPVQPGVWTPLTIDIAPDSPAIILEGVSFEQAFGNVARVQVGVLTPLALANQDVTVTIGLAQPAVTPEPAALALLAVGAVCAGRKRR